MLLVALFEIHPLVKFHVAVLKTDSATRRLAECTSIETYSDKNICISEKRKTVPYCK